MAKVGVGGQIQCYSVYNLFEKVGKKKNKTIFKTFVTFLTAHSALIVVQVSQQQNQSYRY
jgi:hypothetical protein